MGSTEVFAIGIVGAGCHTLCDFRSALYSSRGDTQPEALRIDDASWQHGIEPRLLRRIDRFSQMGIYVAGQCLRDIPEAKNGGLSRMGLAIGNNFGGWSYVEPMMRPLNEVGMTAINPYVATAWFPAAAQGEISIRFGIRGISKTFAADRLSSAYALEYARVLLENGKLNMVLAGGVESPVSPSVLASLKQLGVISEETPAGEAGCLLALRRKTSDNYPQIAGMGRGDGPMAALLQAMNESDSEGAAPDLILLDPPRGSAQDRMGHLARQLTAVKELYGSGRRLAQPLPFGETVGAAFALQVAAGCVILETQRVPEARWNQETSQLVSEHGFSPSQEFEAPLRNIAILASDAHNQWMSAVVTSALAPSA